jgi:hypothetical protein
MKMNKSVKLIITILVVIILIIIPIFAAKIIFIDQFNERDTDFRVDMYKFENGDKYVELLTAAEERFDVNNENADSAPKQTVAALWGVIDIQKLMILQNIEMLNQNYGIAQQNDNIIMQNAIVINNQYKILTTLILLMATIVVIGTAGVLIILWKSG